METSTASTATATKIDEIRARHAQTDTERNLKCHQDRTYLLGLINQIEEGIKYRWSDNEGEVTNGIFKLLGR